jgi:hypothetical protein
MVDLRSRGQIAYDAYAEDAGWLSIRGEHLPRWEQQTAFIQRHWDAAAQAVARSVLDRVQSGD